MEAEWESDRERSKTECHWKKSDSWKKHSVKKEWSKKREIGYEYERHRMVAMKKRSKDRNR